jgi:hypothetical protein
VIGQHFGVTRERVRQILKANGVTRADGLRSKMVDSAKTAQLVRREAASLARWGVGFEERKKYRADGTLRAFEQQRNTSHHRGIEWSLSFIQWLGVWLESGKLELRGRGKGKYCMSRIKDEGGYSLGNVHIQLCTVNNSEGLKKCRNNKPANKGVILMYPNLAKGWCAYVGHTKLGLFATEAEGVAARAEHLARNPSRSKGRGYAVVQYKNGPRYQVTVGKRYVGIYPTPEVALAARAAALQAIAA